MNKAEIKKLLKIIEDVSNSLNRLNENIGRVDKDSKPTDKGKEVAINPISLKAFLDLPVAVTEYYESKARKKWGPRLKTLLEIGAIAVAIWLAILNLRVLHEIKSQTPEIAKSAKAAEDSVGLTKEVIKGSPAAYFTLIPQLNRHAENDPRPVIATAQFTNKGIAVGSDITFDITYTRFDRIGVERERKTRHGHRDLIGDGDGFMQALITSAPNDMPVLRWQVITINAVLRFNDGVGNKTTQTFCRSMVFQGSQAYGFAACESAADEREQYKNIP